MRDRTGVDVSVLPGEDEARLTFLAVRRWFGWSSGRLAVFDIGGGSLEIAAGSDEAPDQAWSLPLGAGRLTREMVSDGTPPTEEGLRALRRRIRADVARDAGVLLRAGTPDHAVATSKTFRSLVSLADLTEQCAPATFAKHYRSLQQLFRWLVEDGELARRASAPAVDSSPATSRMVDSNATPGDTRGMWLPRVGGHSLSALHTGRPQSTGAARCRHS